MKSQTLPIRFEMQWNDSEFENPSIDLRIENTSPAPLRLEVQWGYWHFDSQLPSTAIESFQRECPTGGILQWAEEMIDEVDHGTSKSFFMFGEELQWMLSVSQILSPDMHCLWVQANEERILLLDGATLACWLEKNVVPLFEVE